jgi:hypothetical protein
MKKVIVIHCICLSLITSCGNNKSKVEELEKKIEKQAADMQTIKEELNEKEQANSDQNTVTSDNTQSEEGIYHGAWFDINYPKHFKAKGSMRSSTGDGFDSATFTSPDNSVEFYVFSPQWNGEPTDIALKPTETTSSSRSDNSNSKEIEWWTIEAKDKSYTRSYQKTTDKSSNTIYVIGLKYEDQNSYNKYKNQYLDFKSSLVQFAD